MTDECSQHSFSLKLSSSWAFFTKTASELSLHLSWVFLFCVHTFHLPYSASGYYNYCFFSHLSLPLGERGVGGRTQCQFCSPTNSQNLAYTGTPRNSAEATHLYMPTVVQTVSRITLSATLCGKLQCPLKKSTWIWFRKIPELRRHLRH